MFTPQQFKMLIDGLDSLEERELEQLLECFPFESLLHISILDFETMRWHLKLLMKLSKLTIFYKYTEAVKYSWEFTLMNLCVENVPVEDILFDLLELLKGLIIKMNTLNEFASHVLNERERIFNILAFVTNLKIFTKTHVPLCTDIINNLIDLNGSLPLTICMNLADIASVYKALKAVYELTILCHISLNKFTITTELFDVCIPWLLENACHLLVEHNENDGLLLSLLKAMNQLLANFNVYSKNKFQNQQLLTNLEECTSNLKKVSYYIIMFSGKIILRDESLKLISFLISKHFFDEMAIEEEYITILSELLQLPVDVKEWPNVRSNIFFYVCHYLCAHSSLPWDPREVLESISNFVYSYDRFSTNYTLLKSLCFIYSLVVPDHPNMNTVLLGDELIILLTRFPYSFSKIITYNVAQLNWLLTRGCRYVKRLILVEWLKRDEDNDILARAISQHKVGIILLDIIIDWKCDELASDKAIEMCHKIQDKKLLEIIALSIPAALHNAAVLGRLILSNPGLPDDPELALKICEIMSLQLSLIEDEEVLKAACAYCKYLLTGLKKENNVVALFCRDMRNIQFLAIKVKYVEEDTAVEILRLLKVLILIQKRNHTVLENQIEADFHLCIVGSEIKVNKCLDLLQVIVTSRENVLITPEKSKVLNVFLRLFDITQDPRFADRSFICLTGLLKNNEWLAWFNSTNIFMEIQCSLYHDEKSGPEFLSFLTVWMKILKNSSPLNTFYLPDDRVIANYIKRNRFTSQTRVIHLLQLLDKIKTIFPGNSLSKGSYYEKYHKSLYY